MQKQVLKDGWRLQSSAKVDCGDERISTVGFSAPDWYPVTVPGTVVGGLVENRVYDDPYFGTNLQKIPGYKHGLNQNFSTFPKPEGSPFNEPWWYRTEFTLEKDPGAVWLAFKGINYYADVWLNGRLVADSQTVKGAYRRFEFDVTAQAVPGRKNALAVKITSPNVDDLGITFIDWCPAPPDDSMGIWQPVTVSTTGPAALKDPFVQSRFTDETLTQAPLTVSARVCNATDKPVSALLKLQLENISLEQLVTLNPRQEQNVSFAPDRYRPLVIKNPRVWWPYQLGRSERYTAELHLEVGGQLSDRAQITFGIRSITSRVNEQGARQLTVNGHDILVRGTAWTPDLLLRQSDQQDEIDLAFLKNLNMNTVRLEGKLATDYFWEVCDREGILVMAGWPCCNHWEKWDKWKPGDFEVAVESQASQIIRLRNHPSLAIWLLGSDFPPLPDVEKAYVEVVDAACPDLVRISNGTAKGTALLGETGTKMGPYSYAPPGYWYTDAKGRFADKLDTETGPDMCIPLLESLERMFPPEQLAAGSEAWNFHTGLGPFSSTRMNEEGMDQRFGKPIDLADYVRTAQVLGYESWRGIYEAYTRNHPRATGLIGWMHNSPWPSLIWQLYDYFLLPTGAFFGAQTACRPVHVQYSYDDASIWLVNNTLQGLKDCRVTAYLYDFDLHEKYRQSKELEATANGKIKVFDIPVVDGLSPVYFLLLKMEQDGHLVDRNFYWLSTQPDIVNDAREQWCCKPLAAAADFKPLRRLPKTQLETGYGIDRAGPDRTVTVRLKNTGPALGFFIWVKVVDAATGKMAAPVYYSDNCLCLLPGEILPVTARVPDLAGCEKLDVKVEGWNLGT